MRKYDVTSAGESAEQDRHHRMKVYFIMMTIRMACVGSLLFVRGWWILVAALGGIVLPYLAVVIANQPRNTDPERPENPEQGQLNGSEPNTLDEDPLLIVVDEPADRRSQAKAAETQDTSGNVAEPDETEFFDDRNTK